jgi:uncharacterized protein YdaU (DUF1376 family)
MGENHGVGDGLENRPPHIDADGGRDDMATPKTKRTTAPAYQFYPADFLKDENVLLMSFTEIGIYQVLLCHAWDNRGLPNDTSAIATMLKLPHKRFVKLWAGPLSACFEARGNRLVNPRQERERQKQSEYRRRQSDNGAKGGRPQKTHADTQPKAINNPPLSSGKARALKTEEEDPLALNKGRKDDDAQFRADHALRELQALYNQGRVTSGYRTESAFIDALGSQPAKAYAQMMANLENHKRSHEWRVKGFVPSLEKWLRDGLWLRLLPEDGPPAAASTWEASLPAWAQKARAAKAAKS